MAQKVKTLLVNEDKNALAVFSIYIEEHTKAKIET